LSIRVTNADGYLTVGSIELLELVTPFSIDSTSRPMPAILAANEYIDVGILFSPWSQGRQTATLAVDIGTWVYTTTVSGTGIAVSEPHAVLLLGPMLAALVGFGRFRRRSGATMERKDGPGSTAREERGQ
jgi:hypothetical protein